jgi:alkaline phosphatase D
MASGGGEPEDEMRRIIRRDFLAGLAATALAPATVRSFGRMPPEDGRGPVFRHGVASGDPQRRRVILWTRVTPGIPAAYVRVQCVIYADAGLRQPVKRLRTVTGPWCDFTVKFDASDLKPGRSYYYQFEALGQDSPIGRTRTLETGQPDSVRFAVASCSNYPAGFFAGYRHIADREDLDFVLHVGDYLYEYADGTFGDGALIGRVPSPDAEILALDEYRTRHAQYKTDPDLQEAHRQHPFIAVWDDHEIANGAWQHGAENHQAFEGDYAVRKAAARKAYFEWMPIRVRAGRWTESARLFRSFRIGDLARIEMLDTRLFGRDEQTPMLVDPFTGALLVDPSEVPAILEDLESPERQLLGEQQESWLYRRLEASTRRNVQWHVIGQQVMMAHLQGELPVSGLRFPTNPDQWDGYPRARERLLSAVGETGRDNLIVVTGDLHSSWANEIADSPYDPATYDPATSAGSRAVEFIAPGITSRAVDPSVAPLLEARVRANNPHTKYIDFAHQGYALVDIDRTRTRCEWFHLDDVSAPDSAQSFARAAETATGTSRLEIRMDGPLAPRAGSAPPAPLKALPRSFFM